MRFSPRLRHHVFAATVLGASVLTSAGVVWVRTVRRFQEGFLQAIATQDLEQAVRLATAHTAEDVVET